MTKAFEIPSTPCRFTHMNVRVEKHGDSDVPCVDLRFEGVTLTKAMLIEFARDKNIWGLLFVEGKPGAAIEPAHSYFKKPYKWAHKYKDCQAVIRFGMQTDENELEDVRIVNIEPDPLTGGNTALGFTVQYELDDTDIVGTFAEYLNSEVHLGVIFGQPESPEAKKQQNLALDESKSADKSKAGEKPDGEGDSTAPAMH